MYDVATVLKDAKKKNVYVQLKYSGFNQQVLNPLPRKWVPLTTGLQSLKISQTYKGLRKLT